MKILGLLVGVSLVVGCQAVGQYCLQYQGMVSSGHDGCLVYQKESPSRSMFGVSNAFGDSRPIVIGRLNSLDSQNSHFDPHAFTKNPQSTYELSSSDPQYDPLSFAPKTEVKVSQTKGNAKPNTEAEVNGTRPSH